MGDIKILLTHLAYELKRIILNGLVNMPELNQESMMGKRCRLTANYVIQPNCG